MSECIADQKEWFEGFGHKVIECQSLVYGCVCLVLHRNGRYFYSYQYTHPTKKSLGRRGFFAPIDDYERKIIDAYFIDEDKKTFYEFYERTSHYWIKQVRKPTKETTKPEIRKVERPKTLIDYILEYIHIILAKLGI